MSRNIKNVPNNVSDVLMHGKDSDRTERILLPFTKYSNIMHAPNIISEDIEIKGAPFHLLETDTEELSDVEIRKLCGRIL